MNLHSNSNSRKTLRNARRLLSHDEQKTASYNLCNLLYAQECIARAKHIACYLAFDGEINCQLFIEKILADNKHCYLPIVPDEKQTPLSFFEYKKDTNSLTPNRWGILETSKESAIPTVDLRTIEVFITPLVGFDHQCNRLGLGGGFYDKTLPLAQPSALFVGVAHSCQQLKQISPQPWDIPMNYVVTESQVFSR